MFYCVRPLTKILLTFCIVLTLKIINIGSASYISRHTVEDYGVVDVTPCSLVDGYQVSGESTAYTLKMIE